MSRDPRVIIHWKSIPNEDEVHEHLIERCQHISSEFPEARHFELSLEPNGVGIQCSGHVNGKSTRVAAHQTGSETARHAGDKVLEKLERELRREHDKRIFSPRRKAQQSQAKRSS
jgi:ribosome-associated translation inhibitor RaiA